MRRLIVAVLLGLMLGGVGTVPVAAQIDPMTGRPLEHPGVWAFTPIPRTVVPFDGSYRPGTIVVRTGERRLYLVLEDGKALRYGIGVGREGATFSGTFSLSRKAKWPDWRPTANMRAANPRLPAYMPGGPGNPMGARALYVGSTLYRIHGTTENWSVGRDLSSGCIRMTNEDVIDLYERVSVGATIVVVD